MNTPSLSHPCVKCGCQSNTHDARYCVGCGAALKGPIQVEVRTGQQLIHDSPAILDVRLTNNHSQHCDIEFSIESSTLRFPVGLSQELAVGPSQVVNLAPVSFHAFKGDHVVSLVVTYEGERYTGWHRLFVAEKPTALQITGPTFANSGGYSIGDQHIEYHVDTGASSQASPFTIVELTGEQHRMRLRKNLRIGTTPLEQIPQTQRLALEFTLDGKPRRVILLGGNCFTVGRGRDVDIWLRCPPEDDPRESLSEQISRLHARIELDGVEARWVDLSSRGTRLTSPGGTEKELTRGTRTVLRHGCLLSPANVLPLAISIKSEESLRPDEREAYHRCFQSQFQRLDNPDERFLVDNPAALYFVRNDRWADHYCCFQQSISIGRSESAGIHVPAAEILPKHARIMFADKRFWLEPLQEASPTSLDGHRLRRHELLPLLPNTVIRLGDLEVNVESAPLPPRDRRSSSTASQESP